MQSVWELVADRNREIVKQAFLIGAAATVAKPVVKSILTHPLQTLGIGLTASEVGGASRNATRAAAGARNTYQNLEQARQLAGPTM